jgi:hypothetical protein
MYEIRDSRVSPAPEIGLGKGWIERGEVLFIKPKATA